MARAQTYSNYKHHNTMKVLIGIAPQGTISFVSEAWGGRTSDKFLTGNCDILKNLLPGDLVLADRSFTTHEEVWYYGAKLHIPAFTKGKSQLKRRNQKNSKCSYSCRTCYRFATTKVHYFTEHSTDRFLYV